MQSEFVKRLKNNGWNPIREEVWDTTHKNRVDIFAYHYAFDNWFCFELKNNPTTVDYTKALRQMRVPRILAKDEGCFSPL